MDGRRVPRTEGSVAPSEEKPIVAIANSLHTARLHAHTVANSPLRLRIKEQFTTTVRVRCQTTEVGPTAVPEVPAKLTAVSAASAVPESLRRRQRLGIAAPNVIRQINVIRQRWAIAPSFVDPVQVIHVSHRLMPKMMTSPTASENVMDEKPE